MRWGRMTDLQQAEDSELSNAGDLNRETQKKGKNRSQPRQHDRPKAKDGMGSNESYREGVGRWRRIQARDGDRSSTRPDPKGKTVAKGAAREEKSKGER
jgi:hypothetical protein